MTRSMQPTIAAVERITPAAEPTTTRLAYSYRRGYEDGTRHGKQAAYRSMNYWAVITGAIAALVWVIG